MPRPPLLLTVGEPAGIGPDCIVRAWHAEPDMFADAIAVCPPHWLTTRAVRIGMPLPVREIETLEDAAPGGPALCCWNPAGATIIDIVPGHPSAATATAVVACIEQAARACMQGLARALVTGPIEKAVLREAGFAFPGHTEFLAQIGGTPHVVMMLAGSFLHPGPLYGLVTTLFGGGGALLHGLAERLEQETSMPTRIADSPLTCVAVGAGALLFVLGHGVDALLVLAGGILSWIATML